MEKPELISLKDLCNEIESASFSVKMRGYAPEEVDEFMDKIVEQLNTVEEKLKELDRYEQWLREDVHQQVMTRAQEEARQLLQGAQDKSRAMLESAQADIIREQNRLTLSIQQSQNELTARKRALEQEIGELQQSVATYRRQAVQSLETALDAIREEGRATAGRSNPRRAAVSQPLMGEEHAAYTAPAVPSAPAPSLSAPGSIGTSEDIDRMLEELKRQIR